MTGIAGLEIFVSDESHGDMSLTNYEKLAIRINDSYFSWSLRNLRCFPAHCFSVIRNRLRFLGSCDINPKKVFCPTLGLGDKVVVIDDTNDFIFRESGVFSKSRWRCDAVVTNLFNFPLMFQSSDCPIAILFDPSKEVFAKIHSGRENTIKNIAGKAVRTMKAVFSCQPADIIVSFPSPHICEKCHLLTFIGFNLFDEEIRKIMPAIAKVNGGWEFDLRKAIKIQLRSEGVEKILPDDPECTLCGEGNHFSHRGWSIRHPHHTKTGRFAVVTVMRNV